MNTAGLYPYQVDHARALMAALLRNKAALDASDTGTGKTFVALAVCRELNLVPLVVCPKSVIPSWRRAAQHIGVEIEVVNYEKARGTRKNGVTETGWLVEKPYGSGSFVRWKQNYSLIIFDEAQRCSGATSLNSKLLIAAKRQAQLVLCLSATAADDPRQMKALGFALGLHCLNGGRGKVGFREWLFKHGCSPGIFGGFDFRRIGQEKVFAKIHESIFPDRGARMRKSEIEGFPETQIELLPLPDAEGKAKVLGKELRQLYEQKERQQSSVDTLTAITRTRQALEILKVPEFVDLAHSYRQTSRVVAFVNFRETATQLVKRLQGLGPCGLIEGGQSTDFRQRIIDEFQHNALDFLVCQVQAGGVGLSLHDVSGQEERTALISPCFSGRDYKQVLGRVNRAGGAFSQQFLTFFDDTYEQKIVEALLPKVRNIDLLNDADLTT